MPKSDESSRFAPPRKKGFGESRKYNRVASVDRPAYDFENEEEYIAPSRMQGCLVPVLITLLVIGGILAGICLPAWNAEAGGVSAAMSSVKAGLIDMFSNVKNMILPEEEKITQFSVVPTEAIAPADLVFNVQTSTNVTHLRIVDGEGGTVLEKTLNDSDTLGGDVTKNSRGMIWMLRHTVEDGYSGLYTVQAMKKDGTWNEGMTLVSPVHIEEPAVPEPPIQGFAVSQTEGMVPGVIAFSAQTSNDVVEVRILDDYNTIVAAHTFGNDDETGNAVTETEEGLTWDIPVEISEAYEGNYALQYRTLSDLSFAPAEESVFVTMIDPSKETFTFANNEQQGEDVVQGEDAAGGGVTFEEVPVAETPAPEATPEPTPAPTETPAPTATPVPEPTATPKPTPMPELSASADESAAPDAIKLKPNAFNGDKATDSYARTRPISMLETDYALWAGSGVMTFRGGPMRQNAASGAAEIATEKMTQLWKVDVGSTKLSKSVIEGIGWPGQPAIVKWPREIREGMMLLDEKRTATALKEVILGGLDGKIYFIDLADGQLTREPIDMGAPSSGGVSVATSGAPILGIGQSHSNLPGKKVDNGYHLYNLLNNKRLELINGKDKAANTNYTGATGAALFDKVTGTMVFGAQNGLIYSVELGDLKESFDHIGVKLNVKQPPVQKYKALATKQEKKNTKIDNSVAMYGQYVYYGDETGVLQCVNINTLTPVWAVKTGDNMEATPALDLEPDNETLALYTANTIQLARKAGVVTIRRYNALTGREDWAYEVPEVVYNSKFVIGCVASPVVGENDISDLVIFTVSNGDKGSIVTALKKSNGSVAWTKTLESETFSSPVAVYNEEGKAWLVQAESNGNVHLMDAKTGDIKDTLKLEGLIEASPAVYKGTVVIGTTGKDTGAIYGIQLQ